MPQFSRVTPRLPVSDLDASIAWYQDVLGFSLGNKWPEDEPNFALLERDGVHVQLYVTDTLIDTDLGNAMLSFDVADVNAYHEQVQSKAPIDWGPEVYWYGRREFAVTDPNGYMLIFSEETDDPVTEQQEAGSEEK